MASRRGLSCPVPACRPKNKTSLRERAAQAFCCGTGGGTRTHIPVRIPDFESSASANSATPASGFKRNVYRSIAIVKRGAPLFFSLPSLPSFLFFFFLFVTLVTLVSLVTFFFSSLSFLSSLFFFSSLSFLSSLFLFVSLVTLVSLVAFFFSLLSLLTFAFLPDGEGAVGTGAPSLRCWAQGSWATPRFAAWRGASGQRLASLRGAGLQGNASLRYGAQGFSNALEVAFLD